MGEGHSAPEEEEAVLETRFSSLTPTGRGLTCVMNINIRSQL